MKTYLTTLLALSALALFMNSCEKAYLTPQKVEITEPVSFLADVQPILTEDCAVPTCHVSGQHAPNLTASKAYDELTQLGYVDTSNAEGSKLYKSITATTGKPMPPNGRLAPEEIGYILAWIKQGAQNN